MYKYSLAHKLCMEASIIYQNHAINDHLRNKSRYTRNCAAF